VSLEDEQGVAGPDEAEARGVLRGDRSGAEVAFDMRVAPGLEVSRGRAFRPLAPQA
jgi:hypothetical protein